MILNLPCLGGNMGPFLFFGTSKVKDLFCSASPSHSPRDSMVQTASLLGFFPISALPWGAMESTGYEHTDQETSWTLYYLTTHIWGHRMQTGCMMLLVNYPDSQRGQSPAHKAMQESYLCMQFFCVCLGVYLLSQQTVHTEIKKYSSPGAGQFLHEIKLIVAVWFGWEPCQTLRASWWATWSLWKRQCPKTVMNCVLSSHCTCDFPLLSIPKVLCQRGSFLPIFFPSAWTSLLLHITATWNGHRRRGTSYYN